MSCTSIFDILHIILYGLFIVHPVWLFEETEVWTPDEYKYMPINEYGVAFRGTMFSFKVKACHNAFIGLLHNDRDYGAMYQIILGGLGNTRSAIYTEKNGKESRTTHHSKVLDCNNFRTFWVSWDGGVIWVGTGNVKNTNTIFMGWKNPKPYSIRHIAISTGYGSTGTWRFTNCNDVVTLPFNCLEVDCKSKGFNRCIKFVSGCTISNGGCSHICNDRYDGHSYCTCREGFQLQTDGRTCRVTCSVDNRWCWPGTCYKGLASQCHCAPGFRSVKNLTTARCEPEMKPSLESCLTKVIGNNGEEVLSRYGSSKCKLQSDMFGRFQVQKLTLDLSASFKVDTRLNLPRPHFVSGEQFGITDVSIDITKTLVQGVMTTVSKTDIDVKHLPADFSNNKTSLPVNEELDDGDKLCLTYLVKGGGYLVSRDIYPSTHVDSKIPYSKTSITRQLCYIYDRITPVHCFEINNCHLELMKISQRLTRSRQLVLDVEGWLDPFPKHGNQSLASGIDSFEINIFEVKDSDPKTLMQDTTTLWNATQNSSSTKFHITLPVKNPMLYVICLDVKDHANNVKQARRLVLYDNSSTILKKKQNPLLVSTASNETNYNWQVKNEELCFSWNSRFYKRNNFLLPVKTDDNVDSEYDQITGELPVTGTTNINGITRFLYVLINERTNTILNGTVTDISSESICIATNIRDGDTFKFNIQARDIMNNTLNDSVSVNIDTSVPEITNIWLVRESHEQLYVHHSSDLSLMSITFQAFDIHSGLREVKWSFGEYENRTVLIEKAVSVVECLNSSNCYCPIIGNCSENAYKADLTKMKITNNHIGSHNRRYYFTIKVINTARLVAIEHIDILVDESPPEIGVVTEGPVGSPDIDYTRRDAVTVSWDGFLDHESGIKLYRVSLARECLLNLKDVTTGRYNNSVITETYHNSIKMTFPDGQGKYFATVIAFNYAMSPSKMVCSDGVTFDKSKPKISNITIKHALIVQSIGCNNQHPYHIREDLTTVKLHGDNCLQRCKNKTNDDILNVLPQRIKNKTDSSSLHSFLCTNLKNFAKNIIYTPSDLFEISWNVTEDESQIGSSYVGFGKDISAIDSPDIIPYTNVQQNTHYFQRHPGLIGEKEIYVFIKVVNRAGLEEKVWLGPILADETPPICPSTVNSSVDNSHFTVKWSKTNFLDTEQAEEIGKILFRFVVKGTENKLITPYLEWNIETHGGQCGSEWWCIMYPVNRLQKHHTLDDKKFFMQLHVYNYAGHYCSVNSTAIHIPSLFPPRAGVVMDVLPGNKAPHNDVDVTFKSDTFCFSWKGFDHHEKVRLHSGLGTTVKSDNIISFHDITANKVGLSCERLINVTTEIKYFVTIKATCTGGTTFVSSDGFTSLNKTDVLSSLKVFHGSVCDNQTKILIINLIILTNHTKLYLARHLVPGSLYYLTSTLKTKLFESNDTPIHVMSSEVTTTGSVVSFIALDSVDYLTLSDVMYSTDTTQIKLYNCNPFMKTQTSTTVVPIHWTIPVKYRKYVTHFETGICGPMQDVTYCDETIFKLSGTKTKYSFTGNFLHGEYKAGVKPCFGNTCVSAVWSTGITIQKVTEKVKIIAASGVADQPCLLTKITFHQYRCGASNATTALVYRWGVFSDKDGRNMMSSWRHVVDFSKSTTILDSECFRLPIHLHRAMYACMEPFCEFGTGPLSCHYIQLLSDPNKYRKDVLYDLNLNNPVARTMEQYAKSINIGKELRKLHEIEMDFADQNVNVGGFLLQDSVMVEWFLMKRPNVPKTKCSRDASCLAFKTTTSSFVDFENHSLKESGMFYLCAVVHQQQNVTSHICSNGFLSDNSVPTGGKVEIESNNGYVIDGSRLSLSWSGFQGNVEARSMGYQSDILAYEYAIGTHPGSVDVVELRTSGLLLDKTVNNLHLKLGQAFYATVRAYNHLNKSVESFSEPIIFDNTAPSKGRVEFRNNGISGFVTYDKLFVEFFDVEDHESGIQSIEIGIGSSNNSADIVPFMEYMDYAEISNTSGFQDGHQYFAILQATNRAGLTSYTISDPVIMDSSPPEIGHVLDFLKLSKTTKEDIDYQTQTTSITVSWYGFQDSHSYISEYKVGLGISSGDDNIMSFTKVGLQTEKTWYSNFQQGVKYFSTVEACNNVGLCSRATSNGVIIDNSAPIPGIVVVGDTGKHTRYLSDRKTLHASWIGFQDPHSDIEHFDVCIGTTDRTCDVMDRWNVHMSSSLLKSNLNLPIATMMFVTVRACNNVGVCSERPSPRFVIDDTAPQLTETPRIVAQSLIDHGSYQTITDPSFFKVFGS